jgi:uncharacterized protein YgbK (DUF1537 family)
VLICDAESDEDLARIAIAARVVATPGFFIGTAGLANALAALQAGEDVLVEITRDDAPNLALGPQLAQALASCLGAALERLSGLIVTGGETATALLAQWYVSGIRLVDETEPGISLGITVGEVRVPIVTKPGGFGDASCLVRSLERLRSIRHKGSLE